MFRPREDLRSASKLVAIKTLHKLNEGCRVSTNVADLNNRLWSAADQLRANSKLRSSEYGPPVLGLTREKIAIERSATTARITRDRRTNYETPCKSSVRTPVEELRVS